MTGMRRVLLLVLAGCACGEEAKPSKAEETLLEAARLRHEDRLKEAAEALEGLLKDAPDQAEALAELGSLLIELERFEEAVERLESALALEPRADTAFNLAIARSQLGRDEGARDALLLALRWAGAGTRLLERVAEFALEIAERVEDGSAVEGEVLLWAGETPAGKALRERLRR